MKVFKAISPQAEFAELNDMLKQQVRLFVCSMGYVYTEIEMLEILEERFKIRHKNYPIQIKNKYKIKITIPDESWKRDEITYEIIRK